MALTKVSTGVVDMSQDTGGLVIAKGTTAQQPTCDASTLGSIRENTDENKVEVCTSTGWQFLEEAGTVLPDLTVDYLVVAGGGSGGGFGGGGGAGGLLTNVGGDSLVLAQSIDYSLTVGAGGVIIPYATSPYANYTPGQQGGSSSFSGTGVSTITAVGGGGGNSYSVNAASPGGSGGGGSTGRSTGSRFGNSGTSGQGNSGGDGLTYQSAGNTYGSGGAGGGAGAIGGNGFLSAGVSRGGTGGIGVTNSITVSSGNGPYYAGGGGGFNYPSGTSSGGLGGGGYGGNYNGGAGLAAESGADNSGGGGGGSYGYLSATVGAGGSGVVILRYPDSYTVTKSGSLISSVSTSVPGYKIETFTSGTGTITFA